MSEHVQISERGRGRPPIKDGRPFDNISLEEQIERWERVRHVLRGMSKHAIEHHFDMNNWLVRTSCGTVGCAAGQCALDPWFNRRGFGAHFYETNNFGIKMYNWKWSELTPEQFFGTEGYNGVFTNDVSMYGKRTDKHGDQMRRKPRAQHRIALRLTNEYIKDLKALR